MLSLVVLYWNGEGKRLNTVKRGRLPEGLD